MLLPTCLLLENRDRIFQLFLLIAFGIVSSLNQKPTPLAPLPGGDGGGLRFLTIPETFKSSKTIVWFSRIISVDNLCRKSALVSFNLAWNLATLSLAFSYRFDPLVLLDNDLLNFR